MATRNVTQIRIFVDRYGCPLGAEIDGTRLKSIERITIDNTPKRLPTVMLLLHAQVEYMHESEETQQ